MAGAQSRQQVILPKDVVLDLVKKSLTTFSQNDLPLLERDVNERSVTHKFAEYFAQHLVALRDAAKKQRIILPAWDVDCEYNKLGKKAKWAPVGPFVIHEGEKLLKLYVSPVPDVVVHERGDEKGKGNLLVVEVKKTWNLDPFNHLVDIQKVVSLLDDPTYYTYSLFLSLSCEKKKLIVDFAKFFAKDELGDRCKGVMQQSWAYCTDLLGKLDWDSGHVSLKARPEIEAMTRKEKVAKLMEARTAASEVREKLEKACKFDNVRSQITP